MAETVSLSDLRRGMTLELEGDAYQLVEYKHVYMQQRTPSLTIKVRQLRTGKTFERNLPGNHRLTLADVDRHQAQYLYNDGQQYIFMDTGSYEQFPLLPSHLGDLIPYCKEGDTLELVFYKGEPVTIELPITVDLEVMDTPPSFKGDTAQGGRKPATLQTGLTVKVPMHISIGQIVRIDTRDGEYVSLVS